MEVIPPKCFTERYYGGKPKCYSLVEKCGQTRLEISVSGWVTTACSGPISQYNSRAGSTGSLWFCHFADWFGAVMNPSEVGRSYDAIAERWREPGYPLTGLPQHERALRFVKSRGYALDAACGCDGRFIDLLRGAGFEVEGVDVSARMIELAREWDPLVTFYHADICEWELPRKYDFITGWDGIWHVPLEHQAGVLRKLCDGLSAGGVFIFSMGGLDEPGEVRDAHMGPDMYTATLGIPAVLELLAKSGCVCRHLEYDQMPESHAYVIAQKGGGPAR